MVLALILMMTGGVLVLIACGKMFTAKQELDPRDEEFVRTHYLGKVMNSQIYVWLIMVVVAGAMWFAGWGLASLRPVFMVMGTMEFIQIILLVSIRAQISQNSFKLLLIPSILALAGMITYLTGDFLRPLMTELPTLRAITE